MVVGTINGVDYIKAGEIALSINQQTGQSAVKISGDMVDINASQTLVINAAHIDINGIVTALSSYNVTASTLSAGGITSTGDLSVTGVANIASLVATAFTASSIYYDQHYATWQSESVVYSITKPSLVTTTSDTFVTSGGTKSGRLVTSWDNGSYYTKTLHYLGYAST